MSVLNVSREGFPMSNAAVEGMITMQPVCDNYELSYIEDVVYCERPEARLCLQIILPIDGRTDRPLIVYIPGSAFHWQNVKERLPQLAYLAQMGFAVAALQYRGSEVAAFPSQTLDAKAGICFMKRHAAEYGIDAEKIVVMGDSSGGHTAMMAAFTCGINELEEPDGEIDSSVRGVIDLYGPVNFTSMNDQPSSQNHYMPDSPEGMELGGVNVLDCPDLARAAAVTTYVSRERDIPPILIFHGTNDELVPFEQSCELFYTLKKSGKDAVFYRVIGAHHGGREFWTSQVLGIVEEFICRVTK
ncbi:MAG: alpha/beta hydrolase [Clostridia bacterium]|nr:alpha/beta hydrolase [Clostridia bacterium]